jgi:prolipoprotein diacylglyceryltransferase
VSGHFFVHSIDPILVALGGVHLWWYGLSYARGFIAILAPERLSPIANGIIPVM